MNLTNLEPRWYVLHEGGPRIGFTFKCPHCQTKRLGVAVHDSGHLIISTQEPDAFPPGCIWNITGGTDFHNISLNPSVDASQVGHWHGWITNGEIR